MPSANKEWLTSVLWASHKTTVWKCIHLNKFDSQYSQLTHCSIEGEEKEEEEGKKITKQKICRCINVRQEIKFVFHV